MVHFNPAKLDSSSFTNFVNEIEKLDEEHELEIIEFQDSTKESAIREEDKVYTLHVVEKPGLLKWLFRRLFGSPETARISNVAAFFLTFVKENAEDLYGLDESKAKNFIDQAAHLFTNYPEIESSIPVALSILVNQHYTREQSSHDLQKLQKDNITLTQENKTVKEKLEEYEKTIGTLEKMEQKVKSLNEMSSQYHILDQQFQKLSETNEKMKKTITELNGEKDLVASTKKAMEEELKSVQNQLQTSKEENSKVKEETKKLKEKTMNSSDDRKVKGERENLEELKKQTIKEIAEMKEKAIEEIAEMKRQAEKEIQEKKQEIPDQNEEGPAMGFFDY